MSDLDIKWVVFLVNAVCWPVNIFVSYSAWGLFGLCVFTKFFFLYTEINKPNEQTFALWSSTFLLDQLNYMNTNKRELSTCKFPWSLKRFLNPAIYGWKKIKQSKIALVYSDISQVINFKLIFNTANYMYLLVR